MKRKYKIEIAVEGSWEYCIGDIIGIDKRTFFGEYFG